MIDFPQAKAVGSHLLRMWPLCGTTEDQDLLIREHSCQLIEQIGRKRKGESHRNLHRAFSLFQEMLKW